MKTITPSGLRSKPANLTTTEAGIAPDSNGGKKHSKLDIKINGPKFQTALWEIEGTTPLVVHRFSTKAKEEMIRKMINPPAPGARVKREPLNPENQYNEARYIHKDGWDGFNAAAVRNAMISAGRLVGFKMTLLKISVFVVADGVDATEAQYNLVRIYGKPERFDAIGRLDNGAPNPVYRPLYMPWSAKLRIAFDSDILSMTDVGNLLHRVGTQIGLCEGRYDSKNSAGQGWGCFALAKSPKA